MSDGATFLFDIDGNAKVVSKDIASSLEEMRSKVEAANDRVKQINESLRGLSGKSAEVTAAKDRLRAALNAEKVKMNEASLAIQKQGVSYGQLASRAREMAKVSDGASRGLKAMGGPLQDARDKVDMLKEAFTGSGAGSAIAVAGMAALAIAAVALTAVLAAGVISFAKWVLVGADAGRSMQLLREGAVYATMNAANLGLQVDALAKKVPLAKAEINEMATDLYRSFNNTQLSGEGIVDVMNMVAQATAGVGKDGKQVAARLQEVIDRGKMTGRMQLSPQELQGTGISTQDVATQLAAQLHIGVGDAQKALFEGRVKLDAGAKAMAAAVEHRFGDLNARKLLSFDNLVMKFYESLDNLTHGVNMEPLGKAVQKLFSLLDSSTVTGRAIQGLVTVIGTGLVGALVKAEPIAEGVFIGIGIAALDLGIAFLKVSIWATRTFGLEGPTSLLTFENAVTAGKVAVYALAGALALAAVSTVVMLTPVLLLAGALYAMWKAAQFVADGVILVGQGLAELADIGADAAGDLIDGFVGGVTSGWGRAQKAASDLADSVSGAFKDALGIASPSKVFAGFGDMTVAGFVGAVEDGAGAAQAAADGLAPGAPSGSGGGAFGGGGGSRGGGATSLQLVVNINAPGASKETVKAMAAPPFLSELTHAIEDVLRASGVLVQAAPT